MSSLEEHIEHGASGFVRRFVISREPGEKEATVELWITHEKKTHRLKFLVPALYNGFHLFPAGDCALRVVDHRPDGWEDPALEVSFNSEENFDSISFAAHSMQIIDEADASSNV